MIIIVDKDPAHQKGGYGRHPVSVDEVCKAEDKGIAEHEKVFLGNESFIAVKIVYSVYDLLWKYGSYGIQEKREHITLKILDGVTQEQVRKDPPGEPYQQEGDDHDANHAFTHISFSKPCKHSPVKFWITKQEQ